MKIAFYGAARTVTGSKHLVTLDDGLQILFDCGMFQGTGSKTDELNEDFGFDPASISFLLLSHAHIDHSGLIPLLVKRGFKGKIYCTAATLELTEILLCDSAEIQTYESAQRNNGSAAPNGTNALYTPEDVMKCLEYFETVAYDQPVTLSKDVTAIFINTGHLIGSASIHLTLTENGREKTILYSGDVGRYMSTLLRSPAACPAADYIILESTYGNSLHQPNFNTIDPLLEWIKKTCIQKGGKLIIPAFSVGRTQEVLYALNQLELEKRLPPIRYFVDSPLGEKATSIIKHHMDHFNEKLQRILQTDDDPFDFEGLDYVATVEDSRKLVAYNEPCVIISASGTADAGRVRHHLHSTLRDNKNTILFVGYCQDQSMGAKLLNGQATVEIFGETCEVRAEIDAMKSMSAHGDVNDLLKFVGCQDADKVKNVFLVHGEYHVQQAFAEKLKHKGFGNVTIPSMNREYEL